MKNNSIVLTQEEYKIYSRQLLVKDINTEGQKRLKNAKVLFVGAGGLASAGLLYLAGAGIGHIGIVDEDYVELSNLHRQIIYNTKDIGIYKVIAASKHLNNLNPKCHLELYPETLTKHNGAKIMHKYDIIIDSTDNFGTRYLLSDLCYKLHKIHIYGAVASLEGQVSVFNYQGGPSYKDLYPFLKSSFTNSCTERGVIGILPGMIGLIQATEAFKIITGLGEVLSGEMLTYNSLNLSFKKIKLRNIHHYANVNQYTTGHNNISKFSQQYSLSIQEFRQFEKNNQKSVYLIDLRQPIEYKIKHLINAINIPLTKLKNTYNLMHIKSVSREKYIIIYCNSWIRSQIASQLLEEVNISHWVLQIKLDM